MIKLRVSWTFQSFSWRKVRSIRLTNGTSVVRFAAKVDTLHQVTRGEGFLFLRIYFKGIDELLPFFTPPSLCLPGFLSVNYHSQGLIVRSTPRASG